MGGVMGNNQNFLFGRSYYEVLVKFEYLIGDSSGDQEELQGERRVPREAHPRGVIINSFLILSPQIFTSPGG